MLYMVTFTINIPPMLAYIPYMDPLGLCKPEFIKLYFLRLVAQSLWLKLKAKPWFPDVSSFNCPQSIYMWVWFEKGALQILMAIDPCVFPRWNLKVICKTYQGRNIHTQLHISYILIITTLYIYICT